MPCVACIHCTREYIKYWRYSFHSSTFYYKLIDSYNNVLVKNAHLRSIGDNVSMFFYITMFLYVLCIYVTNNK